MQRVIVALTFLLLFTSFAKRVPSQAIHKIPFPSKPSVSIESSQEVVTPGKTLWEILSSHMDGSEIQETMQKLSPYMKPNQVKPNTVIQFLRDKASGYLMGVEVLPPGKGLYRVWREPWKPFVEVVPNEQELVPTYYKGTIQTHIVGALEEQGAPPSLAITLVEMFQWDVDFYRDLQVGDQFGIVCLQSPEGEVGGVFYAWLRVRHRTWEGFYYHGHYYDRGGRPLRKMFLRAPLTSATITSGFSLRRMHPIFKKRMPHFGVDYAAPLGTPVIATARGKVVFKGYKKGYGNTVVLQHPGKVQTAYLHLHGFARGLRVGKYVDQGEVIGYVGKTGYATGPHVDYRITVRGKYVNPLTFTSPPGPPLPKEELSNFHRIVEGWEKRFFHG